MELVVADDGSTDETAALVKQFKRAVDFPVRLITHPHAGFCPGRCRNEGVAASEAEYILLLDGDCLIPPDHVRTHLERRRQGLVWIGERIRLDEETSAGVDEEASYRGTFESLAPWSERYNVLRRAVKAWWHNLRRHPQKPYLTSNNVGLWRDDYYRVNGFDENYVGWGCEDDDFGLRLRRCGLTFDSIVWWTNHYHLWHPSDPSAPNRWHEGTNVALLKRNFHLRRCGNGIVKRRAWDIELQIVGRPPANEVLNRVLPSWCHLSPQDSNRPAEVEVLFAPSERQFSGRADCNLLVVPASSNASQTQITAAHLIVAAEAIPHLPAEHQFPLHDFAGALEYLITNRRFTATHFLRAA